jgi:hypothetical protein
MLRLPDVDRDLVAGCSFAITQVLAAVVSGISVTLYSHNGGSGMRFKGLLKDYYPWARETGNAVTPQDGANILYSVIRNPLTHDLGLDLENKRQGQKIVIKRLSTNNKRKGLPEHFIEQLESPNRPIPMSPTVRVLSGRRLFWSKRSIGAYVKWWSSFRAMPPACNQPRSFWGPF